MIKSINLKALAEQLGGSLHLPAGCVSDVEISGIAPIDKAKSGDITFLINPEYMKFAASTQAGGVIVGKVIDECLRPQLVHENPYWAFATTFQMFAPRRDETRKVDSRAFVAADAKVGHNVTIYAGAYVSEGCVIGDNAVLYPGVYLGRGVVVGDDSELRANVVIEDGCRIGHRVLIHANTSIGADGFGFAPGRHEIAKIPQVGIVRIDDDVEIGAGSTIDRAAMGETLIGKGCKLDSSVHVAHNVKLGDHTMVCGGSFVAGSAKIGRWCILAGCSSVNNHVEIADRVVVGALAGVTKSLKEPGEYMGFPAMPAGEWRREIASVRRIRGIEERLRKLEQQLGK
jgi:UDP-3-O-[3-hydroxymyristoyl] glucosamine N-acyltransferase